MRLAVFDSDSGRLLWASELPGEGRSSPTYLLPGERVAIVMGQDQLSVFDAEGEVQAEMRVEGTGVVAGSTLVMVTGSAVAG